MQQKILGGLLIALALACQAEERRAADVPENAAPGGSAAATSPDRTSVVFLGTSLTAGLGIPADQAFPALIQDTLDALGLDVQVINAGISGETSAGGLRRVERLVRQPVGVLVLELGANDALRGLDVATMRSNLEAIIDRATSEHPEARVVILGMRAPPNMGAVYAGAFDRVFPEIAQAKGAALVPFLLDSVAGIAELNQDDGIHPTAEGHRIMARTVWRVLEGVLRDAEVGGSERGEGRGEK